MTLLVHGGEGGNVVGLGWNFEEDKNMRNWKEES
jgi:hypothetical protein